MTEIYSSGNTPQKSDTKRMLLVKEVKATTAMGLVTSGSGAPSGTITGSGIYYNTANDALYLWYGGAWHLKA